MHGGDLAHKVRKWIWQSSCPPRLTPWTGPLPVCYPKEGLGVLDGVFYPGDGAPAANYTSENKRFMISVSQRM